MNFLGFNSTHDAAAALVRDGRIVCAVEEERLSRQKHHYGFPELAIRECLRVGGIEAKDIDGAAYAWDPAKRILPLAWHVARHFPLSLKHLHRQERLWGPLRPLRRQLEERIGYDGPFRFLDHHENHLASAYWPSGFREAAALSVDGTGEWATTVLGRFRADGSLETYRRQAYPHSLGKLWEAVTQFIGFRPNSGEGKVMGLAPYGGPRLLRPFRDVLRRKGPGRFDLNLRYFEFHLSGRRMVSDLFLRRFGAPREPEAEITQRDMDLAWALQELSEELLLEIANELHERSGSDRLVLAGGVALNSVANGRIQRETPFREIFVQPAAGDSGAALGAALRLWHQYEVRGDRGRHVLSNAFLGPEFSEEDSRAALEARSLEFRRVGDAPAEAAERLARGEIVGWFQGAMEFGPRALGNRSILADPRRPETKDIVNARVKHREGFRPFAPAILAERAGEYFETGGAEAPYMLKVFDVRPEKRDVIPAVTHVDGSARVQTVRRSQNAPYYDVIKAFGEKTGVPVVLNTSFNVRGEPIVCTPAHAVDCFLGTGIDTLFLGSLMTEKCRA